VALVSHCDVAAPSEHWPVAGNALDRFLSSYQAHLFMQVQRKQEAALCLVGGDSGGCVPSQWSIPHYRSAELGLDQCEGVGDVVAELMEGAGLELMFGSTKNQLDCFGVVESLNYELRLF